MKRSLFAFLMLLGTSAAFADMTDKPDYSQPTILKILHEKDVEDQRFKLDIGRFTIHTKNVNYHFNYLPVMQSIPYAGPHGMSMLPNPFVLTNTEYAWRPHSYKALADDLEDDAEYRHEYRRTEKLIKQAHVVAKVTTQ